MSVTDVIAVIAILVPVLLAILGSVWFLSARIERVKVTTDFALEQMKNHNAEDSRRFNEVFSQLRELASQHFRLSDQNFWIASNGGTRHDKTPPYGQG